MKRPVSILVSGFLLLASSTIPAQIDTNANTLSDLWEQNYNSGDLFPNTFDPTADPDKDGWTNVQEAAAGTDPFDPNPPNGFLRPDIHNIPAVFDEPDSNGDPVLLSPNAIRVSWQTIPGKKYTLLYSPNLESTSWLPVEEPFIGTGSITEYNFPLANPTKTFWRVRIEDTDSDGDGLTDAEENQLETNPAHPDSDGDGVPDAHEIILASNPNIPDSDNDGMGDAQEMALGTNPIVAGTAKNGNEALFNSDFSNPTIGTGVKKYTTWDYWVVAPNATGWHPMVGGNIEYQVIESKPQCAQYCELKADPAGNHGIWQAFGAKKNKTYLIVMDCKARAGIALADNNFDIQSAVGTGSWNPFVTLRSVTFSNQSWTTAAASFKAEDFSARVALMPTDLSKPTRGCLVDNVRLAPVGIEDNLPATGVDNVSITAYETDKGWQDKFWIMAPCGNYANDMYFKIPLNPPTDLKIESTQAIVSPATTLLEPQSTVVNWKGTGASTTETFPVWKVGSAQTPVDLPIGVKLMKRRTVKISIHEIGLKTKDEQASTPTEIKYKPTAWPRWFPTKAVVENHLNQIFEPQINVVFEATMRTRQEVEWDLATTSDFITNNNGLNIAQGNKHYDFIGRENNTSEETALETVKDSGADINIYVLGTDGGRIRQLYIYEGILRQTASIIGGVTNRTYSRVVIDGDLESYNTIMNRDNNAEHLHTIAHEIGHCLVGYGHPDDKNGPAPLEHIWPQTLWQDRLMINGDKAKRPNFGRLLVKGEWDAAEVWLIANPDARIKRERHLGANEETGNY